MNYIMIHEEREIYKYILYTSNIHYIKHQQHKNFRFASRCQHSPEISKTTRLHLYYYTYVVLLYLIHMLHALYIPL